MSAVGHVDPSGVPTRGRRFVVTGAILIAVAVLGGMSVFAFVAGRIDIGDFERDVVVDGARTAKVPGELRFSVDRRLGGADSEAMSVAVAVDHRSATLPHCTMTTADGEPVDLGVVPYGSALLHENSSYSLVSVADLRPGDYVASCRWPGEPSDARSATRFTVGRTLGNDDMRTLVGPLLGLLAVAAVAATMFIVGLVVLIIGLVRTSRDRRGPSEPGPGWPPTVTWPSPPTSEPPTWEPPTWEPPTWEPSSQDDLPHWPTPPGSGRQR